jgi:hypothetical protein
MASGRQTGRRLTQQAKTRVLIVCEGRRTEVDYFNALGDYQPVQDRYFVQVEFDSNAIDKAIELKKRHHENGDPFRRVWAVADVEGPQRHSHFKTRIRMASAASVVLCFSNPSFEYWLLLHLVNTCTSFEDATKVKTCLNSAWKKKFDCEYSKTDRRIFERLLPEMKTALKRAHDFWHGAAHRSLPTDPIFRNPSTGVQGIVSALLGPRTIPCQSPKFAHETETPPVIAPASARPTLCERRGPISAGSVSRSNSCWIAPTNSGRLDTSAAICSAVAPSPASPHASSNQLGFII